MASVLYLTYDGLTDNLGQSQILPYLLGLTKRGHHITIVSFEKNGAVPPKYEGLSVVPLSYHKFPPVLSTVYDILHLRQVCKKMIKHGEFDIVHCRSYITALVGLHLKRKYGIKLIFDMRGFWADERVEGGLWKLSNPLFRIIYRFFKNKEKKYFQEADLTVSLTENAKDEIVGQGILTEKIKVIPCCADLNHFSIANTTEEAQRILREKYGILEDDFVLLYLGSLGTWYMLKEMLDFYGELRIKWKRTKFLFLTKDVTILHQAISERNYRHDEIIVDHATREQVPAYISICSASIFYIIPTYSKKASSATKMGEIMAMGKPVITNTGWGDVEVILGNQPYGVLTRSLDTAGYAASIEDLKRVLNTEPRQIASVASQYFSLESGIAKYNAIYTQLIGQG